MGVSVPQEWYRSHRVDKSLHWFDGQAEEMRASLALLHDQVKELTLAQEEN